MATRAATASHPHSARVRSAPAATLANKSAYAATAVVVVLLVLLVQLDALQGLFTTTALTSEQWLLCMAVGSTILIVGELLKLVLRARLRRARRTVPHTA